MCPSARQPVGDRWSDGACGAGDDHISSRALTISWSPSGYGTLTPMRLAWFTPWPPQPTGVAGRSEDVTRELARRDHAIDVFVDASEILVSGRWPDTPPAPGEVRVQSAHDFIWRHGRDPYDLVVYQIGNSTLHEFIWPYLFRWPGLVVLHDARLHHARGRALLRRGKRKAYRAEFRFNHPDAGEGAEIGVRGFSGVYYYQWPMVRAVVESARLVATHARGTQMQLAETFPGRTIAHIALGMGRRELDVATSRRAEIRAAWGLAPGAVAFGIFGGLTPEKRIDVILRAFAAARVRLPHARLVLGGTASADLDLDADDRIARPRRRRPPPAAARRSAIRRLNCRRRRLSQHALAERGRDVGTLGAGDRRRPAHDHRRPRAPDRHSHARSENMAATRDPDQNRWTRTLPGHCRRHRSPRRRALAPARDGDAWRKRSACGSASATRLDAIGNASTRSRE